MIQRLRRAGALSALACIASAVWSSAALASQPLVLDTAGPEELASLDGVGPALAADIIALRDSRKGLNSVEELRILPGVTEATLDTLRSHTTVQLDFAMGPARRYDSAQQLLAEFGGEPSIQQAQAWASDYANTSPQSVERWLKQSKSFAALPTVLVRFRFTDDWDQDFQYYAADGLVDQDGEVTFNVLDGAGRAQEGQYTVQASWDLDKLVMSSERIRMIGEAQDVAKLRDKVLTEVNRIYFERRRVQAEMMLSPKGDILGQVKDELRVMELTANLDAMTGGRFTAALSRGAAPIQ
jgi:competence protein ComEA